MGIICLFVVRYSDPHCIQSLPVFPIRLRIPSLRLKTNQELLTWSTSSSITLGGTKIVLCAIDCSDEVEGNDVNDVVDFEVVSVASGCGGSSISANLKELKKKGFKMTTEGIWITVYSGNKDLSGI